MAISMALHLRSTRDRWRLQQTRSGGVQPSAGRPLFVLDRQIGWTLSAWGPLVPWLAVYSTLVVLKLR